VKTRTPSGVTFRVAGNRDSRSSLISGDIEAKYSDASKGINATQTWTTTNILRTQLELENQFAKGLKLDVSSVLIPEAGAKSASALVNAIYKQPGLHTRAFLDLFKVCPFSFLCFHDISLSSCDNFLFPRSSRMHMPDFFPPSGYSKLGSHRHR